MKNEKQNKPCDRTSKDMTRLEAIEASLVMWYDIKETRGKGNKLPHGCQDNYWWLWFDTNNDDKSRSGDAWAEAIYQFILGKYWEEKNRVHLETLEKENAKGV